MKLLSGNAPEPTPERHGSRLVHQSPDARVVAFRLQQGQVIPPHSSDSTVVVQVVDGEGVFEGADGELRLGPGAAAVYAPGETHSIRALEGGLHFLAILAPSPR